MKTCVSCGLEYPKSNFYKGAGRCKPCKQEYDREYRKNNRTELRKIQRARRVTPDGYIDRFMERVKLRTPDTDITRGFFCGKMEVCSFTGMKFSYNNVYDSYHNPVAPSIDRIDSKVGYYTWNTQVILSCVNRMKNDLPQKDFESLWQALMYQERSDKEGEK